MNSDMALASAGWKSMTTGTLAMFIAWVMNNHVLTILGFVVTALGFVVNLIFRIREDRRQQEVHDAQLAKLKME